METTIPNLFIIGDSSSWTRGVGQAATSGLLAGEGVRQKLKGGVVTPEKVVVATSLKEVTVRS
jgi:hypothetical protein